MIQLDGYFLPAEAADFFRRFAAGVLETHDCREALSTSPYVSGIGLRANLT